MNFPQFHASEKLYIATLIRLMSDPRLTAHSMIFFSQHVVLQYMYIILMVLQVSPKQFEPVIGVYCLLWC